MIDTVAGACRVSVVIPHLNTPDLLALCLASVTTQGLGRGNFEVIVADNGSQVSLDEVRQAFPSVIFIREPAPGPGLARNAGAKIARAPVLAFIDADCRATPGWLEAACAAIEIDPARTIVGGDIRIATVDPTRMTGMEAFESVFGFRQRWYIEQRHFSVTANLAMGATVLAAVGPFGGIDVAEDFDWGRRAYAAGYPTRYLEAMLVYHPARPDFDSMARKWARLVDHDRRAHVAAGHKPWRWKARAAAMLASVPVDGARLLLSPKLTGIGNRWRGLVALAQIRAFRAAEMLRAEKAGDASGALAWNRQP